MLDNIDIQYVEYECRVHIILYPGFFPCNKKSYRMIRNLLKHLPPDIAKDKAAQIALHIDDLQKEAQGIDEEWIRQGMIKKIDQQWKYYHELIMPFLNYDGGSWYGTKKNI